MKRKLINATLALVLAGILTQTPSRADTSTREIMKQKLTYSQGVLEGIALENFALIGTNAHRLGRLSHATGWFSRQTPEYELFTNEYRRHADTLVKAARDGNLDGATVAYFQLTLSCVNCHKYIRGARAAGAWTERAGE
jgi:hypothetical protein